ncbi:hypothetical protein PYI64_12655, partial [Staphylococcus epidermidis]|nr:hypothetical protein [Staphylococcus epidermidis]
SRKRNLFSIEHKLNKGNTTFPIYAAAGVQMSTITEPGTKRLISSGLFFSPTRFSFISERYDVVLFRIPTQLLKDDNVL